MDRVVREAIDRARQSKTFRLQDVDLDELPEELLKIPDLLSIVIPGCGVEDLPDWLLDLNSVTEIDLFNNKLRGFPLVLLQMPRLRVLGLGSTGIRNLPTSIDTLRELNVLCISGCDVRTLPQSMGNLASLRFLDISNNPKMGLATAKFPRNLKRLACWGNDLLALPAGIAELPHLRVLEASAAGTLSSDTEAFRISRPSDDDRVNRIIGTSRLVTQSLGHIPHWLAVECPQLRWLDLSGSAIEAIPNNLGALRGLEGLLLAGNRIRQVPESVMALPRLTHLALSRNRLSHLPAVPANLTGLRFAGLDGNDLAIPPEILTQYADTPTTIWDFVSQAQASRRPLDEAKIVVVGEGSVGKTSLIRQLVHNGFNAREPKTDGIEVTKWGLNAGGNSVRLNVWDFGGQEIMHATHQFFLTRRSVYVLVVDARQSEEQNRLEYWLKLIKSLSDGSPVVLVGNKCENLVLDIDQRGLRAKYPEIAAIIEASCAKRTGIDDVQAAITDAVARLPHVRDLLPGPFFDVKEQLESLDADYLPFTDYEELCARHGVLGRDAQELLVGFLHDLGTVLCFREDPRLKDTNILNPSWVTGGVYRLLNANLAAQRKGLLLPGDIETILAAGGYPSDKHGFIIEMMKKFELCYESEATFLIPDLLTKEEPDTGSWEGGLDFSIKYDVLPSSVIGRLIVRMHGLISKGTVWRTGMVLTLDRNRALVKADREDGVLAIRVVGPPRGRRGILTAIRAELRAIEQTIPGLVSEERVPVPDHDGIWVPYSHLLQLEEAGLEKVIPQGLVKEFLVTELLDGVEARDERPGIRPNPVSSLLADSLGADDPPETVAEEQPAAPWGAREALTLGAFLVATLLIALVAYATVQARVGGVAAGIAAGSSVAVMVIVALIVLRSAGRLSETGFLGALKEAMSKPTGNSDGGTQ